jgi:oxalate---CoA ligase
MKGDTTSGRTVVSTPAFSIQHLLETQARQYPEAIALLAPERNPLTYIRLLDQLSYINRKLKGMGVGAADRVALVLPNGPEMAVAFLGVAASCVCAPLNPNYRTEEFHFYLSDLQTKVLIVEADMESSARLAARELGIHILELQPIKGAGAGSITFIGDEVSEHPANDWACFTDLALVLHTSGTTSRPKIVPLTQAKLCISSENVRESLRLTALDRCLNIMPLFHVHGLVAGLMASLAAGASVICPPAFLAPRFFEWMAEFKPTWYTAVPSMHQAILDRARDNNKIIASNPLRFIRSCSAPLPPTVMAELEFTFGTPVLEAYGMTEASHQICCNPLPPGQRKPGSVGVPTGCLAAVMDEQENLLQAGQTGEIVIQGGNVTEGYENNSDANQKAFINGWLRTGDQGYLDVEGYVFLTGRVKEIINRGGEKISPREVDEVLLNHPGIAQVVTFGIAHPRLGEEVAAAVVLRPGNLVGEREIRRFAAERLAYFKVPRRILFLDTLPKGPTGKVQRIGLVEKLGLKPEDLKPPGTSDFIPPRNELEKELALMWTCQLDVEKVGVDDNFFLSGGDSILAAKLISRVRQTFGVEVPFFSFFEDPTVAGLARAVEEARAMRQLAGEISTGQFKRVKSSLVPIKSGASWPPLFLAHAHDGEITSYYGLARKLRHELPVYGFRAAWNQDGRPRYTRVEEMAAVYVDDLLVLQPEGPYFLGGYCFGAHLAFEMAGQLRGKGKEVAYLALMDSYAPGFITPLSCAGGSRSRLYYITDLVCRFGAFLTYVSHLRPGQKLPYLTTLARFHMSELIRGLYPAGGRSMPSFLQPFSGSKRRAVVDYLETYHPQVYQGSAVLFRPYREPLGYSRDPLMGWAPLVAGGVKVEEIPGYHRTLLFGSGIGLLAARLNSYLS